MRRRHFILAALAAASSGPTRVTAQALQRPKRVGWVLSAPLSAKATQPIQTAFEDRLRELGWVEGRSIAYLRHGGLENDERRVEAAIRELVSAKVDLIFAPFGPHAVVARRITREIPIVFAIIGDPVAGGLAASLARPGGNATGPSTQETQLRGPRLQYLREAVPSLRRVAVLMNPDVAWNVSLYKALAGLCAQLGLESLPVPVRRREDFGAAIEQAVRDRADALLHMPDGFYFANRRTLVQLVGRSRLAATYTNPEYVDDGGLMAYAIDIKDVMRKAAEYVDKILRGAYPGDLPVEQSSRYEFVVNLKTARAQGFVIPPSLLLRADRVIE
jgi:putative ABC transport system substrate-binding protein